MWNNCGWLWIILPSYISAVPDVVYESQPNDPIAFGMVLVKGGNLERWTFLTRDHGKYQIQYGSSWTGHPKKRSSGNSYHLTSLQGRNMQYWRPNTHLLPLLWHRASYTRKLKARRWWNEGIWWGPELEGLGYKYFQKQPCPERNCIRGKSSAAALPTRKLKGGCHVW